MRTLEQATMISKIHKNVSNMINEARMITKPNASLNLPTIKERNINSGYLQIHIPRPSLQPHNIKSNSFFKYQASSAPQGNKLFSRLFLRDLQIEENNKRRNNKKAIYHSKIKRILGKQYCSTELNSVEQELIDRKHSQSNRAKRNNTTKKLAVLPYTRLSKDRKTNSQTITEGEEINNLYSNQKEEGEQNIEGDLLKILKKKAKIHRSQAKQQKVEKYGPWKTEHMEQDQLNF